jgi:hypothetical protein
MPTIRILHLTTNPAGFTSPRQPVRMHLSPAQHAELYGARPCSPSETWQRTSNQFPPGQWATHRLASGEEVGIEVESE